MSKIDINDILQSKTWDLISKTYGDTPVLEMNLRQLEQVCRAYGFTKFLTESKGQAKLAKTEKKLGILTVGVSLAPYTLGNFKVDLCSSATVSCKQSCVVYMGGNPAYIPAKQKAMVNRKGISCSNPIIAYEKVSPCLIVST